MHCRSGRTPLVLKRRTALQRKGGRVNRFLEDNSAAVAGRAEELRGVKGRPGCTQETRLANRGKGGDFVARDANVMRKKACLKREDETDLKLLLFGSNATLREAHLRYQ